MSNMEFLDPQEAEKFKKQKWPMFCGTPCSPSSGAPDDRVGRFCGILFSGRFRGEVRWPASDIVVGFKNWLIVGVLGNSVGLSSFPGASAFLTIFLVVGRSKVGFLVLMVVAAGLWFPVSVG